MKTKTAIVAALIVAPFLAFAQPPQSPQPPQPPVPPNAPQPPGPPPDRHGMHGMDVPKEPVTFLGVETSPVPQVLCDQMNLPKGFGLVVDYVVPDGPAAAAGVQQNDILKMLNDQILMEPGQLSKLIRSFSEGTTVTLTVLRKGQEQKIPVKLTKKDVPKRHAMMGDHDWHFNLGDMDFGNVDLGDLKEQLSQMKENLKDQLGNRQDLVHDAVMKAQEEIQRVRDEAQQTREHAQQIRDAAQQRRDQVQQQRDEGQRQREEGQRMRNEAMRTGQVTVTRNDGDKVTTTHIDLGKAQIVFTDDKGELHLDSVDGKKILTVKDPQGKLLFGGPVDTQEQVDKLPADVRQRYENLQERDLRAVISPNEDDGESALANPDNDSDEDANDDGDDDNDDNDSNTVEQVSTCPSGGVTREFSMFRTIFI